MLKNFLLSLSYAIEGKKYNYLQKIDLNKNPAITVKQGTVSFDIAFGNDILIIDLNPQLPITVERVSISLDYDFNKDCRLFMNGYQSKTETKEYSLTDKMKPLHKMNTTMLKKFNFEAYGDYNFARYFTAPGKLHGFSYMYIKNGNIIELLGALSERTGFTIFYTKPDKKILKIEKDVEGVVIKNKYNIFNLAYIKGSYESVFDKYFEILKIDKPKATPKCGYTTWYNYKRKINEKIVLRDLMSLSSLSHDVEIFQIDDGYQKQIGDWLDIDTKKFPKGMKFIADQIHEKNMLAGIWLTPFVVSVSSKVYKQHKDWLVKGKDGKPLYCGKKWGGFYTLDLYNKDVSAYVKNIFDTIFNDWGYDLVKLDYLYTECILPRYNKSRGALMHETMDYLRIICQDKLILGGGVPMFPAFGKVDYCRIGPDIGLNWQPEFYESMLHRERVSTLNAINNIIYRRHLNFRAFVNDPDVFLLRKKNIKMNKSQKTILANLSKIFGGLHFTSDNVAKYKDEELKKYLDVTEKKNIEIIEAGHTDTNIITVKYKENGIARKFSFSTFNGKIIEDK